MSDFSDLLNLLATEKAEHEKTKKRLEEALYEIKLLNRKIKGR